MLRVVLATEGCARWVSADSLVIERFWLAGDELPGAVWVRFFIAGAEDGYVGVERGQFRTEGIGQSWDLLNRLAKRAGTAPSPAFVLKLVRGVHSGVGVERDSEGRFCVHIPVRFPSVTVKLIGTDGNAFAILRKVRQALRRGRASDDDLAEFQGEATAGDYDHLLATVMRWVEVE